MSSLSLRHAIRGASLLVACCIVPGDSQASETPPHVFHSGDVIRSAEVNENFAELYARVYDLEEALTEAESALDLQEVNLVPIGGIIDWWRPSGSKELPPEGWAVCDGGLIEDAESAFYGTYAPDLRGVFARGAAELEDIGAEGGATSHAHTLSLQHGHDYDIDHNHASVSTDGHLHRWAYFNTSEDWYSYDSSGTTNRIMNWSNGIDNSGSGEYPLSHSGQVTSTVYYYTGSTTDTVDLPSYSKNKTTETALGDEMSTTEDHLPPHLDVFKVMRIK